MQIISNISYPTFSVLSYIEYQIYPNVMISLLLIQSLNIIVSNKGTRVSEHAFLMSKDWFKCKTI